MEKTSYTPGPWRVNDLFKNIVGVYVETEKDQICEFHTDTPNVDANARLIAAAPELLEALIELCDLIKDGDYDFDSFSLQPAKRAIAKATGEQITNPK